MKGPDAKLAVPSIGIAFAILLLTALHFNLASWHDFGWTAWLYVLLQSGYIPHVDYFISLPQLSYAIQFLIYRSAKDPIYYSLIYMHGLWVCCVGLTIITGYLLRLEPPVVSVCALLVVVILEPSNVYHPYNYLGALLYGGAFCLAIISIRKMSPILAWVIGVLVGLALFAKPNFGIATGLIAISAFGVISWSHAGPVKRLVQLGMLSAAGFVLGILISLLLLSIGQSTLFSFDAILEVLRQTFTDAGNAKGGIKVALRWIPRYNASWLPSMGVGLLITAFIYIVSIYFLMKSASAARVRSITSGSGQTLGREQLMLFGGLLGLLAFLAIVSRFLVISALPEYDDVMPLRPFSVSWNNCFWIFCLIVGLSSLVIAFKKIKNAIHELRNSGTDLLCPVAVLAGLFAVGSSSIDHVPYAAPTLLPALAVSITGIADSRSACRWLAGFGFLFVLIAYTAGSYNINGYHAHCELDRPQPNRVTILTRSSECNFYHKFASDIFPHIRKGSVAWFIVPGPAPSFAGKPARGIGIASVDTYSLRIEARLLDLWQMQPPDFFVISTIPILPPGSEIRPGGKVRQWIDANYKATLAVDGHIELYSRATTALSNVDQ